MTQAKQNSLCSTGHFFDNFILKDYKTINLPPTIDSLFAITVYQGCGTQELSLTGISDGEWHSGGKRLLIQKSSSH